MKRAYSSGGAIGNGAPPRSPTCVNHQINAVMDGATEAGSASVGFALGKLLRAAAEANDEEFAAAVRAEGNTASTWLTPLFR